MQVAVFVNFSQQMSVETNNFNPENTLGMFKRTDCNYVTQMFFKYG